MQPSGCPCYSSEGRSERRSFHPPLGGRPPDATTFVASEKRVADAALHRVMRLRRNFLRSISIETIFMRAAASTRRCPMSESPHARTLMHFVVMEVLERAKGLEPSTPTLARSCSTTELHPHPGLTAIAHRQRQSYAKCGPRMQQPAQAGKPPADNAAKRVNAFQMTQDRGKHGSIRRDCCRPAVPPIANPASKRQLGLESGKEHPEPQYIRRGFP